MRTVLLSAALLFAMPSLACPMSDHADYQAAADKVQAADGTKLTVQVEGMHCGSCSDKITAALGAIDGVTAAATDYTTGRAQVAFDASKVKVDAILAAIQQLGFKASVAKS